MTLWLHAASRLVLPVIVAAVTTGGCGQNTDPDGAEVPATTEKLTLRFFRDPAPVANFTAQALDGRTISSADWQGKVVVVNFWATWCPPCKAEIPDLVALQDKYRDQLLVIGVSEDESSPGAVRAFMAEHHVNYPVVMSTPEVREAFPGVAALPTSFVIDPDGRVVQKHVGMLDAATTELETRVLAGLSGNVTIEFVDPGQPIGLANAAQVTDIPGVDLTRLTQEKRIETILRLNAEVCTCGCEFTVARCRIEDPSCDISLPLARQIAAES